MVGNQLPQELHKLARKIFHKSLIDGISMDGMEKRFDNFMSGITSYQDLSKEQLQAAAELIEQHRIKVREMNLE
ncbi:hypothetical protein A6R79_01635 [Xanthomonas translucens pv. translucens]|nr:hypothetical protein A6R79_01635 [Xanthomonas translucens pv. translucens]